MPTNPNREPALSLHDTVAKQNLTAEKVEVARQQLLILAEEYQQADTSSMPTVISAMNAVVQTQICDQMVDDIEKGVGRQLDGLLMELQKVVGEELRNTWFSLLVDKMNEIAARQR